MEVCEITEAQRGWGAVMRFLTDYFTAPGGAVLRFALGFDADRPDDLGLLEVVMHLVVEGRDDRMVGMTPMETVVLMAQLATSVPDAPFGDDFKTEGMSVVAGLRSAMEAVRLVMDGGLGVQAVH